MESKVCITITANSSNDLLTKLAELEAEHSFFELRLDGLKELSTSVIEAIVQAKKSKVILTLRTKSQGGLFEGSQDEYRLLVEECFKQKSEYVDVELSFLQNLNLFENSNLDQTRAIVSHHDFLDTPDDAELNAIVESMKQLAPEAILKIACMTRDMSDVLRLVDLQKAQEPNKSIMIAMGQSGQLLRMIGPSIGAFASFASAELSPAAPGQLYYKDMLRIFNAMESTKNGRK